MALNIKLNPKRATQMHRRLALRLPIPVTELAATEGDSVAGADRLLGFAKNLSAGGMFISAKAVRPVGETLSIKFRLPESGVDVRCRVRVMWHRKRDPYAAYEPGMGVRFEDLDFRHIATIDNFVRASAHRDPSRAMR